ncbi:MAG: sigma 54-interacting transcriptional regulator, partial [Bernardetiaceae bacterium]|nr:sigma 54-interacting transcriptional regulator [Bernardetiaceae bacterium]
AHVSIESPDYIPSLKADIDFVRKHYPAHLDNFISFLWRDMQHYYQADQIMWFKEFSNARHYYKDRLFEEKTKVSDLRDIENIGSEVALIIALYQKKYPEAHYYINIGLGSSETQVVWHLLSQAAMLPKHTSFLSTYDSKDKFDKEDQRFKKISIKEVPLDIFDKSKPKPIFSQSSSDLRKMVNLKMEHFVKSGFTILLLGERGIGKSRLAEEKKLSQKFVAANCASFDDDSKAEAELFGYEKGAFTGSKKEGSDGLFQEANGGILFLDEIHHLSKRVQGKLMKALQTDEQNHFKIRKMGGTTEQKIMCKVVFASNRTIDELRHEFLYEDFFDRISQQVIQIPPLRETPEDREADWKNIWQQMKFTRTQNPPEEPQLVEWLRMQPLYGNYRDLQKIAIYYHNYLNFSQELKILLKKNQDINTAFDYTKQEFEKLNSPTAEQQHYFSKEKSIKTMQEEFKRDLAQWAHREFGTDRAASEYFEKKFGKKESAETATLNRWRNNKNI